jgi:hypothetical protein
VLIVAPWSAFWDRNVFARTETLAAILASPVVRGAVSGVGIITALAGLAELAGVFVSKRPQADAPTPPPAEER